MDPMDPHRDDDGQSAAEHIVRLGFIVLVAAYFAVVAIVGWQTFSTHKGARAAEAPAVVVVVGLPRSSASHGDSTGVPMVDRAVAGFVSGDANTAFSELAYQRVSCGTIPHDGWPGLVCLQGENPGSPHEMFLSGCEPTWITAESARSLVGELLFTTPYLFAVDEVEGGYRAVLAWQNDPERSLVANISLDGVTSLEAGCDLPEDIALARPLHW